MKPLVALLIAIQCLFATGWAQDLKPNEFYVGAAELKINPAAGAYLAGYQQNRKSTGIHDDLFAKAIVISNTQNSIAIVSIDCIGLPYPAVQRIREAIEAKMPAAELSPQQVIISSTHTHSGADVIGIWGENMAHNGVDTAYENLLMEAAAEVVVNAWKKRQVAKAQYASTHFGAGWVENISVTNEIDKQLSVLQFVNKRNKNISTLVNFACHPTIIGKENTLSSADYPAGIYQQLDAKLGGINLFLQGAIGGWVQPENIAKDFETAQKQGKALAYEAINILKKPTALNNNNIRFTSRLFEMPISNPNLKQLAAANVIKRDIAEGTLTEVAWFSVGEASFATHPGETSPLYSLETKNLMQTKGPKFVLGLGMDELGYILNPDFFKEDTKLHAAGYLTSMSPGPDAGPTLMQILKELAERDN